MKQIKPLVSIIMPVHNTGEYLVEAIDSIRGQTYKNFELICVNDASTDNSASILENFQKIDKRITVTTNKTNRGISYSLNKALEQAQGEFIARMDGDDISLPTRIEKQVAFLQAHPRVGAVGTQVAMISYLGNIFAYKKFPVSHKELYKMIMKSVPIQHPALMARGDLYKNYRYREDLKTAEDVDLLFYFLTKGNIANLGQVLYKYRKSQKSNGYHNVKQTFAITFKARFEAIGKYNYTPSITGLVTSLLQYAVVLSLPSKLVVLVFEAIRFERNVPKALFSAMCTFVQSLVVKESYS